MEAERPPKTAQARRRVKKKPDLRERALRYLARREYSRAELRGKLLAHVDVADDFVPFAPENVDALLDDLAESGYLSDARAVKQLLHSRRGRFGTQRIIHELHHKGISAELIDDVLPDLKAGELDAARCVWLKKFGSLPHGAKEKARQMRFLQSRGFGFDVILKLFNEPDTEGFE